MTGLFILTGFDKALEAKIVAADSGLANPTHDALLNGEVGDLNCGVGYYKE